MPSSAEFDATDDINSSLRPLFPAPPITVVLSTALVLLFFLGLFSIYFCRCFLEGLMDNWYDAGRIPNPSIHGMMTNPHPGEQGLDPSLIKLFPTFLFSDVNKFRKDKHELECAICLAEFEDVDLIRLLTACYHVFHLPCIDLWLESNKTCPVCRRDLAQISCASPEKSPFNAIGHDSAVLVEGNRDLSNHFITVTIDNIYSYNSRGGADGDEEDTGGMRGSTLKNIGRSHSTGHSIVVSRLSLGDHREEEDRYTLRLVKDVTVKMITPVGRHCATESCIVFGEFSSPQNDNNGGTVINSGHGRLGEVQGTSTKVVS
ncbi:RING-H2 finger protein ATL30 [Linum grandiflorum]